MRIWIEKVNMPVIGMAYEISSEYSDGIVYKAKTEEEAIKKFEEDKGVKVTEVKHFTF